MLIMKLKSSDPADNFPVERMTGKLLYSHYPGFIHFIADHSSNTDFLPTCFQKNPPLTELV